MLPNFSGIVTEEQLLGFVRALGPYDSLSEQEEHLLAQAPTLPQQMLKPILDRIERREDPLGDTLQALRSASCRRPLGATYTPMPLVHAMLDWAEQLPPTRCVDPGAGTGRFIVEAGRRFPKAKLIAIEIDPTAALLLRAHLKVAGLTKRTTVFCNDYRRIILPQHRGTSLFLGNPPYVRHHQIDTRWKDWLSTEAQRRDLPPARQAGLHVHFLLSTANLASPGDRGIFITAAEWLDTRYGALPRKLFLETLGLEALHLLDPRLHPFPETETTALISCFHVGARPETIQFRRLSSMSELSPLRGGRRVTRHALTTQDHWSYLAAPQPSVEGTLTLGELFDIHRGQVTGNNRLWIAGPHSVGLPDSLLLPTVTKASDLFKAANGLRETAQLRRVIDIPSDLTTLTAAERRQVEEFLRTARSLGGEHGYIAQHRRAWWSVGLRSPAPIIASYMARRPPIFVRNYAMARHLNIAHGLYPRVTLTSAQLDAITQVLNETSKTAVGRIYSGGLIKFEPSEMGRLRIPKLPQIDLQFR